jgi:hypothetical protein
MPIEKRIFIMPNEIVGIEYECSQCLTRCFATVLGPPMTWSHCPNCGLEWLDSSACALVAKFVESLHELSNLKLADATIRLQIEGDLTK